MEPLALITCLDGVGEMATLNLGTQRCEQPLQPFFQQSWLLFPRLLFTWSTGSCAACSLWRHPRLVWLVVVAEHGGAPTNYRTWLRNRHTPFSRPSVLRTHLNEIKTQMSTEESVHPTTTTMKIEFTVDWLIDLLRKYRWNPRMPRCTNPQQPRRRWPP